LTRAPLTAALVERRLSELQQLSRLGASLAEAAMPPIGRNMLERRSLRVVGRAPGEGADARDIWLHVSSPAVDRQLGWMPEAWVDPVSGAVVGTALTMLAGALVGKQHVEAIARGSEAIVILRFLTARPPCVDALPLLEEPDRRVRLWLCSGRDRARTQW
jgi:hypothetical protein